VEPAAYVPRYVGYPVTSCDHCEELFLCDTGTELRAHLAATHGSVRHRGGAVPRLDESRIGLRSGAAPGAPRRAVGSPKRIASSPRSIATRTRAALVDTP